MLIEEKAKRYDKAIEIARKIISGEGVVAPKDWTIPEVIFPELRESEDEKIRKELINFVKSRLAGFPQCDRYIAWLEKQEIKPKGKSALEALKEENPDNANKVEQEFHEGDWVVYKNDICQIVKREEGCNKLVTAFGIEKELVNERNLSTARLWTIQDAKNGDVLVTTFDEDNMIVMYHSMCTIDTINVHCCLDNKFTRANLGVFDAEDVKPATKEQRDLLFSKMYEAGYIFDFKKKKLKKLKFRVGDEVITENEESLTITRIDEEGYWSNDLFICDFDSEHIWDLVEQNPYGQRNECLDCQFNYAGECKGSCAIKRNEQESAWSEEDKNRINRLIAYFEDKESFTVEDDIVYANWLKSLKQRYIWKPSDEQIEALKEAVDAYIVEVEDNNYSMCAYTHLEICTDEDLSKICKAGDKAKVIIIKQK